MRVKKYMIENEYVVDRIENNYIVLEDKDLNFINIKKEEVLEDVREGDILIKVNNKYIIDYNKTKNRKDYINKKIKNLWEE